MFTQSAFKVEFHEKRGKIGRQSFFKSISLHPYDPDDALYTICEGSIVHEFGAEASEANKEWEVISIVQTHPSPWPTLFVRLLSDPHTEIPLNLESITSIVRDIPYPPATGSPFTAAAFQKCQEHFNATSTKSKLKTHLSSRPHPKISTPSANNNDNITQQLQDFRKETQQQLTQLQQTQHPFPPPPIILPKPTNNNTQSSEIQNLSKKVDKLRTKLNKATQENQKLTVALAETNAKLTEIQIKLAFYQGRANVDEKEIVVHKTS